MSERTLYFNPRSFATNNPTSEWFSETDCPIIVKGSEVTFRPEKMINNHKYKFRYGDEDLIAVKHELPHQFPTIEIFEILNK
jgi:hypothetical protein